LFLFTASRKNGETGRRSEIISPNVKTTSVFYVCFIPVTGEMIVFFSGSRYHATGTLRKKTLKILKKLAPECGDLTCSGSGHQFHSILPPVSNHFSEDSNDFIQRINRLSDEELTYVTDMIQKGEESMGCLPVEDV